MWITKKGKAALAERIVKMEGELREKLFELGEQAKRDPDLPENPIWKQLQIEVSVNLPKKIGEAKKILLESMIIEDFLNIFPGRNEKVNLGARVIVKYEDGTIKTFVMVGPYDTEIVINGLSYLSPLGKSIMRAEVGEEKVFFAPNGEKRITIISFSNDGLV